MTTLEICAADTLSVDAARTGGADRIELCSALDAGGLTPSAGLIRYARRNGPEKLHVLIRPRPGDFVYDKADAAVMADDIETAISLGADGVVIGALTRNGDIDLDLTRRLIDTVAGRARITFHRAIDMCRDIDVAVEQLGGTGIGYILTSGGKQTALAGTETIRRMQQRLGDTVRIIAASGVTPDNAAQIIAESGVRDIHASARSVLDTSDIYVGEAAVDSYSRKTTDPHMVRSIREALNAK